MAASLRIMHYINAFFAGIGGEEEAHTAVSLHHGPLGPGRLLEQVLAGEGQVIATVVCGDGYFSANEDEVVE
ncbi:MAG: glycine/sarcosine/betaine reductase selenoprotein B family protein, partial [Candidatus Tectomicrobia bacterium]